MFHALFGVKTLSGTLFAPPLKKPGYGARLTKTKGTDLFRYKGILAVKGQSEKYVFQGVHMLHSATVLAGQRWSPDEPRANKSRRALALIVTF